MGLLSSIGHFLENPIQPITHAIGKTAGVTANTQNGIHVDPKKLALTAGALALPGVGGAVGGALSKIPGIGALGSAVQSIPGVSSVESMLGKVPGVSQVGHAIESAIGGDGSAGGGGGLLQSIEGFLTGNGGLNALGAAQGVNAALQQKKSTDLANQALSGVQSSYNQRAPLRAQGIQGLLTPSTPDLSALTATRTTGNPYAGAGR